ncbi:MAG: glycosyltransferase family 2 protein, partial [Solirubrobacterales bacterium]|nr:glycosyltransferase family 2 protein [Solirubrobacterales bacterium]
MFITPYYQEDRRLIERCIRSVQSQDPPADHMLVADGHPQRWLDSEPVRHIVLDKSHGDFGNAARGTGGLLAASEGCDGIGFLDADNWLEKNHLSTCLEEARQIQDCDFVIARRNWRRPDGTLLRAPDEPIPLHVDTNCLYLLPGSFHVIP